MKTKVLLLQIFCFFVAIAAPIPPQNWYPRVDETSYWNIGSFANGALSNANKLIKLDASTTDDYSVFWYACLWSARINSTYYKINGNLIKDSENQGTTSGWKQYTGYYHFVANGTTYGIACNYKFYKDGKYYFYAWWSNHNGYQRPAAGSLIVLRLDYDLGDASAIPSQNDIIEHATLESNTVNYWYASSTDFCRDYPALPTYWDNRIENNAYCRIVNVSSPATQFFAVFWPLNNTPISIYAMNYSNDQFTATPASSYANPLQTVASQPPDWPQYAYHGNDQVVYAILKRTDYTAEGISGKVFQKPNGRSLRINTFVMSGIPEPDLNTVLKPGGETGETFLNQLTNNRWHETKKLGLSNPYGNDITEAEVIEFLANSRNVSPSTYTVENRENFQDWFADIGWINSLLYGNPLIGGVMCDDIRISDPNYTEREGCAVLWPSWPYPETRMAQTVRTAIHECGHCFNLQHYWGHCTCDGAGESIFFDPAQGCGSGSIMTYGWDGFQGSYYWYSFNLNFYQLAPESWAKSGRYGNFWRDATSAYPPFYNLYQ